jgi:hypothetical protein
MWAWGFIPRRGCLNCDLHPTPSADRNVYSDPDFDSNLNFYRDADTHGNLYTYAHPYPWDRLSGAFERSAFPGSEPAV